MIPDLTCPTCAVPLSVHPAGNCLEEWAHQLGAPCAPCSRSIHDAWELVEMMVVLMNGYERMDFRWDGPLYKPDRAYLTSQGYPLGTTCWYVRLETRGWVLSICGDTPALAITRAFIRARSEDAA